jgi:hypothetical protein
MRLRKPWCKEGSANTPRRCLKGVDFRSKRSREFISIDEESKHEIVHAFGLRKTNRASHSSLDPRAEIDVFALDFLRIGLPHFVLCSVEMALIGTPPIRIKPRDAKRRQEGFELHKDRIVPSPKDVREHCTAAMIDRMPEPPRVRFAAHVTSHFVQLGREPALVIEPF